jgi:phosphoglycolate phosphatase-like HAD superfamily hydrolase
MTLILFDIDGTLTATNAVDAKCYAAAFQKVFGTPLPSTDWEVYEHCTDFAIADEALRSLRGSPTTLEERDAFERLFVAELKQEYAANPRAFDEVAGARALLKAIEARDDLRAAIATGGMKGSACYKLSRIGVDPAGLAAGFANDAVTREAIVRCAIARADGRANDLVYVGDGPWDVRTAAAVGMRFIGIVGETFPEPLCAHGAMPCLRDFTDRAAFFKAVHGATVPRLEFLVVRTKEGIQS